MKKTGSIVLKMVFIGVVVLVLVIADVLIGAKVKERDAYREEAISSIYDAAGGSFVIKNVELIVPYVHHAQKTNYNGQKYIENQNGEYSIQTKTLNVNADVVSEVRNVGIYKAPVYSGKVKIDGEFLCNLKNNTDYTYNFKKARIGIRLKDSSLIEIPVYTINGVTKETEFGSDYIEFHEHDERYRVSRVPLLNSEFTCVEGTNTFSTELNIRGANSFRVYVNGNQTRVNVKSDWPSPGFTSYDYLPVKREISDKGFTAEWFVPFSAGDGDKIIGFDYKQPVEVYKMLNRAVTYGFLFIIVPFLVLFLYELFMKIQLHVMHYLLCGAASIVFFLLLLSVSEHISFGAAYIISSCASGLLTSSYVAAITKQFKAGIGMSGVFLLLYGYLFFSLKSEDYSLLIGSIFVFIIIAALMFFTRKIDWNNLGKNNLKSPEETE
ncbi:MAG: cell envelope integrity protein CreD [Treponema sp.]|uniref:cell envelope integrity protein CreD n=1 Tax=Treponema sp. TaxID=166 RepID=UPI00298E7DFF|nr:cell envelope integrity protein CreD [Treponema sp.]MCQ2599915.1 cell envelope integrity protein CreD [Treponema sp.]